jgi:hypothetical protein
MGQLINDPTRPCYINRQGEIAALSVYVTGWGVVLLFAGSTAYKMNRHVQPSRRQKSEVMLLSLKCVYASLFLISGLLAISAPARAIGVSFDTSLVYAFATVSFWIEYKLFLDVPTLSSVTAIAYVIAPHTMRMYMLATPAILITCTALSFLILGMVNRDPSATPSAETIGTLHVGLSGGIGFILLGSHALTMTIILRKFNEMQVSQSKQASARPTTTTPDKNSGSQLQKLGNVEGKIRQLRNETAFLAMSLPPALILLSAVSEIRAQTPYLLPLGWTSVAIVVIRFVYMSNQTVRIHLRRQKTDAISASPDLQLRSADGVGDKDFTARDTTDASPMNSGEVRTAFSAISNLAKKRKKRRQKFINLMTRVEEEKSAAMTKVEERFTVVDTNEFSHSEKT